MPGRNGAGFDFSQTVFPVRESNAITISSFPRRYIVYSRSPSATIWEYPSPSGRLHSLVGPDAGHALGNPLASIMKLRCGPPYCGQSAAHAGAMDRIATRATRIYIQRSGKE